MTKLFDNVEKFIAIALLGLMAIVVVSATLEVAYLIAINMFEPPGFFIGVKDLFDVFGLFLMVLIGLELMTSIHLFIKDNNIHAELILLVAMTAITRKVVILDAKAIDPMLVFAIGFVIIALAVGYYLVSRSRTDKKADSSI